ncbi:MAG: hypothetical protein ABJF01_22295 [bacterium]
MSDRDRKRNKDQNASRTPGPEDDALKKKAVDNEWMRDQTGENTNLSGSTTFRTLPDQPEDDNESERDTKDRQSNR